MNNNWNFKSLGTDPPGAINILPVSTPLSRQGSIYSWTLDQIQSNLGRDCGSMNLEELLMNVSSTEETQGVVPSNGANEGLHREGSISLPRMLSQKTVDEVWKYITEEEEHPNNDGGRTNIPQIQREQTLGDVTLEEFLIRAGAMGNNNSGGDIHNPSSSTPSNPNTSLSVEFQHNPVVSDVLNNIVPKSGYLGSYLHPNVNGSTSTHQLRRQQQQNLFPPQQPIMSKPHGYGYGYGTQLAFTSGQVNSHGIRGSFMGTGDQSHQENNISLVQSVTTVPVEAMSVDTRSPVTQFPVLDGIQKTNVGSSSVSPSPYNIGGGYSVRNRKNNNDIYAEKRVEKIQRRKIKNRESAARSRARKQAQTMELEAEVEKLRKENLELLKKQSEISKMEIKLGKGVINQSNKQLRRTKSDI